MFKLEYEDKLNILLYSRMCYKARLNLSRIQVNNVVTTKQKIEERKERESNNITRKQEINDIIQLRVDHRRR